jgi:(p)ppGpp synthase/HD superfamily hydrolase
MLRARRKFLMDAAVARNIAHFSHAGQRTRQGKELTEHVESVAAAVPPEARTVAFLHDVLEKTSTRPEELRVLGLTAIERCALELLTRREAESFEAHTLRIAHAAGTAGRLARHVKLADIDDHLGDGPDVTAGPPYAWARRHIAAAQERRNEAPIAAH